MHVFFLSVYGVYESFLCMYIIRMSVGHVDEYLLVSRFQSFRGRNLYWCEVLLKILLLQLLCIL